MNKLFTKITSLALGAAMMIGVGAAVGSKKASPAEATDTTVTLAPRNVTSVADKDDDNGKTWAMASDAQGFTSNSSYVHAGSGSKTVSYLRFSTTAYNSNTIKSISLYGAAAANSSATLKIYVGGTLKEESEVLGNNASSGGTELTWTNTDSSSGEIKVEVSRSSATKKALYFNQVIVTITSGPTKLATPTGVSYDSTNQEVKWNSVSNASSYKFSSDNGSSYTSTSTNLYFDVSSFTDGTTYNCKVVAVGDGSSYSDSDAASYSFTKTATPSYTSVSVTGGSQQGTEKGSAFIQCSATATGTNIPESPSYTWYVTETNTYGTTTSVTNKASIDNTGKVTFDDSCTVYVWALAPDGSTHNTSGYAATASELVDAKGSQNNPYTVAEARYALDNGGKVADVYAKGIVSSIVTAYSTQYKNVTYNLSDDGTTSSDQLQAFRLSSETDPGVKVGDVITVTGSLTIYGSTYEFGADCTLYRHAQIQSLTVTTSPENEYDAGETFNPAGLVVSATYNNGESNHSFSYANHESNFGFDPGTSTPLTSTVETVTITYGNGEVSFPIEVTVAPAVISVEVDPSSKTAYFEDEFNISVSVTTEGGASAAITWSIEDNSSLISIKNGTATDTSVTIVVGTTVGTAYVRATSNFDNQVYARCKVDVKDPDALVDTINRELTGVSSGAGYSNWSGKSDSTSAVYAGNTAGGNDSVQVNSSYGFYNTASAGYVREIEITFDSHTSTSSRTVTVYGYTTARSSIDKTGTVLGSATYNGTDATYTINVDAQYEFQYFLLSSNGAVYLSEIVITYEKIDTNPSIQLIGPSSLTGKEGSTDLTSLSVKVKNISSPVFAFTFDEDGTKGKATSSYVSVSEGTPTDNVYPLTINFNNIGSTTVNIDVSGETASFAVEVIEVAYIDATLPAQYRLVNDVAMLNAGDKIVIADNHDDSTKDRILNSTLTSGYYGASDVAFTNSTILTANISDGLVFTLGGSIGGWTLMHGESKYLAANSSKNFIEGTSEDTWTIEITNGNATITYEDSSYGYIMHNVNNTRFKPYTSDPNVSMRLPQIYKYVSGDQEVEIGSDLLTAISSAKSKFTCDASGNSFDGTAFNSMASDLSPVLANKYLLDYADSSESGNVVEEFLAMYDYAVGKYGSDYDFLGRIATGKISQRIINPVANFINDSNAGTITIVIISVIGVSALGGFFFLRKRKEI